MAVFVPKFLRQLRDVLITDVQDGDGLSYDSDSGKWVNAAGGGGGGSDDQTAAEVPFTPAGTIAATDTQAAVEEVASDAASALSTHSSDTTSVHGITDTSSLYVAGGTDVALADGGTGASLSDPGADRVVFWDESGNTVAFGQTGAGLAFSGTVLDFAADMATQAELDAHINDSSAAHAASAIGITDAGGDFTATDVEGALAELQADHETDAQALADHIADTSDAHDASAISFSATGSIAATDAQSAIAEVATDAASALSTHESDTTSVHGISDTSSLYRAAGTDVALADGGTGASLSDPNADRILFWDDSGTTVGWLEAGSGLTLSGTVLTSSGGGGATVATTVAGLGTASDGKIGMLRVGSSPYSFVRVVYDATYGKWVSDPIDGVGSPNMTAETTTSGTYSEVLQVGRIFLPFAKEFYDAGLRPQVCVFGYFGNSGGGNTTYLRSVVGEAAAADTGQTIIGNGSDVTIVGSTQQFAFGGFEEITVTSPTDPHWMVAAQKKVSAGTGTYVRVMLRFRWVSA